MWQWVPLPPPPRHLSPGHHHQEWPGQVCLRSFSSPPHLLWDIQGDTTFTKKHVLKSFSFISEFHESFKWVCRDPGTVWCSPHHVSDLQDCGRHHHQDIRPGRGHQQSYSRQDIRVHVQHGSRGETASWWRIIRSWSGGEEPAHAWSGIWSATVKTLCTVKTHHWDQLT